MIIQIEDKCITISNILTFYLDYLDACSACSMTRCQNSDCVSTCETLGWRMTSFTAMLKTLISLEEKLIYSNPRPTPLWLLSMAHSGGSVYSILGPILQLRYMYHHDLSIGLYYLR